MGPVTRPGAFEDQSRLESELMKARVKARLFGQPVATLRLGRFELLRPLGQGSFGSVYEARDTDNDAVVALKLLRTRDPFAVRAFKREFRGLTDLVHENLAQLYELFTDDDEWYFTMELVRGVHFMQHVRRRGPGARGCDVDRLRPAFTQLLSAVHAIHAAGKLHCDLKPGNALVTEAGRLVVLDFGLLIWQRSASGIANLAGTGAYGTPPYMAPELATGQLPSRASDAYGVGAMLFEALTGNPPLEAPGDCPPFEALPHDLDEVCTALLERNPAARMTIEAALERLQAGAVPARASAGVRASAPFVGRSAELSTLHTACADIRHGQPIALLLSGRSGIGKTALVAHFAEQLRGQATVLHCRCHERESLPYKAFDGLVDALAEELMPRSRAELGISAREASALLHMWPDLGRWTEFDRCRGEALPPSRREQRQLAFAGLKQLLRRLAQRGPLVLIVDDLQWADLDSARLLLELLGPPDAPALLYVGSYRSEEEQRSEFLRELSLEGAAVAWQCERRSLELHPLDQAGAAAMAITLLADRVAAPELSAARIARESCGLPFFVSELAAYFLEELSGDDTGLSLSQLLGRRLSALGATERRALELLALAGRPVSQEVLGVALRDVARCARAVRVLTLQGLVHTDAENRVVTYHDRLREQVARDLPQVEASALHRLLARAYERTPAVEPEWLIEHWLGGGEAERALECAVAAAARASAKLAFNRAAALYRTALELLHAGDPRRSELSARLGEALVNAGRGTDAARAFLDGVDEADTDAAYALRCRAAQQYLRYGRTAVATSLLERLFGELGERYPRSAPEVAVKLLLSRGRLALRSILRVQIGRGGARGRKRLLLLESSFRECAIADPLRGLLFQSLFYEEALRVGDPQAAFIGLAWGTYFRACVARAGERRSIARKLDRLEAEAARLQTPYVEGTAFLVRGAAALFQGDYRMGGELTSRAQAIFRDQCPGAAFEESTCALLRYTAVENVGPLSSLCQEMPALVRRASERKDELSDALLATHFGAALLVQDRPEQAIEFLLSRRTRLGDAMSMQLVAVAVQLSDAYAYAGNAAAAFDTIERIWPAYLQSGFDRMNFICMVINLRRAHAALLLYAQTRDPAFARIVKASARRLERMQRPDADTMAEGFRAGLAVQRRKPAEAERRMRRALALAERVGIPVTEQCYRFQLGRVTPGAPGVQLTAKADAALRAQGVVAPERWVNIYVAGFDVS